MKSYFLQCGTALGLTLGLCSPSFAQDAGNLEQMISEMKAQLDEQQKQIQNLQGQLNKKSNIGKSDGDAKVSLKPAPTFESADGKTTFALDGRVAVDSGFVANDDNNHGNATDIRYAWIGAKGTIDGDWAYRFLVGLENDATSVNDMYVAYNGFDNTSLQVGNFKEFNGIENMSSNLHNTFMERSSAVTAFRPLRRIGAGSTFFGDWWSVQLGAFGDDPSNSPTADEGHSFTGRIVAAPILDKENDHVLHLGASTRYAKPDANADSASFSSRGESHVINGNVVSTGTISGVDDWYTHAAELRYTYGPLSLMGEYNITDVNRGAASDLRFDGGYVTLSYFLTGEQRGYKVKNGTYGRVKPNDPFRGSEGGLGAWEIATRYTSLDLTDENITGGELEAYTFGVNWYPNNYTKFMANYVINETDENAVNPNDDPHYMMLRAQIDF